MFVIFIVIIIGKSNVISTSNTKKIMAIKKKCNEKGNRAEFFGSNPHSNGDLFSRSVKVFLETKFSTIVKIIQINVIIIIK